MAKIIQGLLVVLLVVVGLAAVQAQPLGTSAGSNGNCDFTGNWKSKVDSAQTFYVDFESGGDIEFDYAIDITGLSCTFKFGGNWSYVSNATSLFVNLTPCTSSNTACNIACSTVTFGALAYFSVNPGNCTLYTVGVNEQTGEEVAIYFTRSGSSWVTIVIIVVVVVVAVVVVGLGVFFWQRKKRHSYEEVSAIKDDHHHHHHYGH